MRGDERSSAAGEVARDDDLALDDRAGVAHDGDCACVVCGVDALHRWIDDRAFRRARVRAERGADLRAMWIDLGGEA